MDPAVDYSLKLSITDYPCFISHVQNFATNLECFTKHAKKKKLEAIIERFVALVNENSGQIADSTWEELNKAYIIIFKHMLPIRKKPTPGHDIYKVQHKYDCSILKLVRIVYEIQSVSKKVLNPLPESIVPYQVMIDGYGSFVIPYTRLAECFGKDSLIITQAVLNEQKTGVLELRNINPLANEFIKNHLCRDPINADKKFFENFIESFQALFDFACAHDMTDFKEFIYSVTYKSLQLLINSNEDQKLEDFFDFCLIPQYRKGSVADILAPLYLLYFQYLIKKHLSLSSEAIPVLNYKNLIRYSLFSELFYKQKYFEYTELITPFFKEFATKNFLSTDKIEGELTPEQFIKEILNPAYPQVPVEKQPKDIKNIRAALFNKFQPHYFNSSLPLHLKKSKHGEKRFKLNINLDSDSYKAELRLLLEYQFPYIHSISCKTLAATPEETQQKGEALASILNDYPLVKPKKGINCHHANFKSENMTISFSLIQGNKYITSMNYYSNLK